MKSTRRSQARLIVGWLLGALVGTQSPAVGLAALQSQSPALGSRPADNPSGPIVQNEVGQSCHFSGRVVDERGRPVAGAIVVHLPDVRTLRAMGIDLGLNRFKRLATEEQARFRRTTSDTDGRFALDSRFVAASDPRADSWVWVRDPSLVVLHPGHAVRARLCSGFTGGDYDAGDIAIEPGCRLVGRVVGAQGQPLAGARIMVDQDGRIRPLSATTADDRGSARLPGALLTTSTDATGAFAIDGLWNGSAQLWALAPRYATSRIEPLSLVSGATTDCGEVVLAAGERILGRVEDPSSRPVIGACVYAHPLTAEERMELEDREPDPAALGLGCVLSGGEVGERTDSTGHFELSGLEKRPVQVLVDADGFDIAVVTDVQPGTDSLVVKLAPETRFDVDVVDATSGLAVTDAAVEASRYPLFGKPVMLRVSPVAGRAGAFRVHQVRANSTAIRVSAPGRGPVLLSLTGATGSDDARTVPLEPAARITGRLLEPGENPAVGVHVEVWPAGEFAPGVRPLAPEGLATDADGRFAFDGVAASRWRLLIRTDRYEPLRAAPECDAEAGRTATIPDIVLSRGGVLFGTLRDALGQPIAGRELLAIPSASVGDGSAVEERRRSVTDSAGQFEFAALDRGDWVVVAQKDHGVPLGQAFVGWHDRVELDLIARE